MGQPPAGEQRADLDQLVDHRLVGLALFPLAVEDVEPAKERQVLTKLPRLPNVIGHRQAILDPHLEIVRPVRGRGVDKPRPRIIGDMVAGEEGNIVVPLAIGLIRPAKGMRAGHRGQLIRGDIANARELRHASFGKRFFGEFISQDVGIGGLSPAFFFGRVDLIDPVRDRWIEGDRAVLWDSPRRRCPDYDRRNSERIVTRGGSQIRIRSRAVRLKGWRTCNNWKLHPDRVALVVVVFDLGLGQGGFLDGGPHHGFRALVEAAVHHEFHELLGDHRLGLEIHGQVGLIPIAGDAEALELLALDVDPAFGEFAAFGAQLVDRHIVLVLALLAVLFLDLPLDGQAVAVPAGDVAAIEPAHLGRADHHILQDLVQRMPDMEMPVGIGRAVMQREGRAPLFRAQAAIDIHLLPTLQPVGLAFGQARAHGEIGGRQEQRVFIVRRICVDGGVGHGSVLERGVLGKGARNAARVPAPLSGPGQ